MNMTYKRSVPYTSTLGGASYYLMGRFVSNILIAENELYGKTINFPTESASWRTQYSGFEVQLESSFNLLARKWENETKNLSSIQEIVLNPAYQRIIGMGPDVIPIILHELDRCPAFWFWALRCLTDANPVTQDMRGDVGAMTKAWINWGKEHGYL